MTLSDLATNFVTILPITVLLGWACMLLLVDLWIPPERKGLTAILAAVGLSLSLGLSLAQVGYVSVGFNGLVDVDGFAIFLEVLFAASGLIGIALAYDYLKRMGLERGEYYILLMFTITGMMLMAVAADLIIVFLSLELLSLPLYVLAGFARPSPDSEEAALKYFLLGAFAGGIVVYGVALVFGATGTTSIREIAWAVHVNAVNWLLLKVGAALILIGLGFKVAAVPFHMWTPDVYQGAPSAVTAFMAVGAKTAGFAALLRVFVLAFPALANDLTPIFWALAALTMIVGNVVAIAQSNIKRLLAYSSIAHAGYLLMALATFGEGAVAADAVASALFYLVAYAIANFGTWAVVIALERAEEGGGEHRSGLSLDEYAGLGRKSPLLAAAMAVFMFSFTGVPPTLGFMGKFYLFRTVLEVNSVAFIILAVVGVLTSLVSAYYYLHIIVIMYMHEGEPQIQNEPWLNLTAGVAALSTVILGLFAAPLFEWVSRAVLWLF